MENKELNLQAISIFLNRDICVSELVVELIRIYNSFTMACMKLSAVDGVPVDREDINSMIYLDSLIEVFREIQRDNENENKRQ